MDLKARMHAEEVQKDSMQMYNTALTLWQNVGGFQGIA